MDTRWIDRWANLLVEYSLNVKRKQTVLIAGPVSTQALLEACYKAVLARGAYPRLQITLPELGPYFLSHANSDQLGHLSPIALYEARHCDARIVILGDTNTRSASSADPKREAIAMCARQPVRREALKRPRIHVADAPVFILIAPTATPPGMHDHHGDTHCAAEIEQLFVGGEVVLELFGIGRRKINHPIRQVSILSKGCHRGMNLTESYAASGCIFFNPGCLFG